MERNILALCIVLLTFSAATGFCQGQLEVYDSLFPEGDNSYFGRMAVDHQNNLWIVTPHSLWRLDSDRTTPVKIVNEHIIRNVEVSSDGVVWALSENWLYRITESATVDTLACPPSLFLALDAHDTPWLVTTSYEILQREGTDWIIYPVTTFNDLPETEAGVNINSFAVSDDGDLWIGTYGYGAYQYNGDAWNKIPTHQNQRDDFRIVANGRNGKVWILGRGAYCFMDGEGEFYGYYPGESGLYTPLYSVTEDSKGNLLFGHVWGAAYYDGESWAELPEAVRFEGVFSVVADRNDEFWLGSWHLWKWDRDAVFVDDTPEPEPLTIRISPNPFNPSTTLTCHLPEAVNVSLHVYALTGQKVATLAEGRMSAGTHAVVFDGAQLASGVYVYRLEAGNVVKSGKMLLMK